MIREGSGEFVICPDGLETVLVEDAISYADTEVVLVCWELGKFFGKA